MINTNANANTNTTNINTQPEITYQQSTTKSYWCHLCKKEFNKLYIENLEIQCRFCSNYFCEELTPQSQQQQNRENENDHPSNFIPYESETSRNSSSLRNSNSSILDSLTNTNRRRPRTTSSLLDMIFGLLRDRNTEEASMESIINMIMQNH